MNTLLKIQIIFLAKQKETHNTVYIAILFLLPTWKKRKTEKYLIYSNLAQRIPTTELYVLKWTSCNATFNGTVCLLHCARENKQTAPHHKTKCIVHQLWCHLVKKFSTMENSSTVSKEEHYLSIWSIFEIASTKKPKTFRDWERTATDQLAKKVPTG